LDTRPKDQANLAGSFGCEVFSPGSERSRSSEVQVYQPDLGRTKWLCHSQAERSLKITENTAAFCLLDRSDLVAPQDFTNKKRIIAQGMSHRKTISFLRMNDPMM
jgi:hypothetical protein